MSNKIKVLMVEPKKEAYETEIGSSLKDMQIVVGGNIETFCPYDEPVVIVCNEEGKLHGLPLNRVVCDGSGNALDIIAGTFFVCRLGDDEDFASLTPALMEKFKRVFLTPQVIEMGGSAILASNCYQAIYKQCSEDAAKDEHGYFHFVHCPKCDCFIGTTLDDRARIEAIERCPICSTFLSYSDMPSRESIQ